jgi:hypothetical protein
VPDLPLYFGVHKQRASLTWGPHLPAKHFYDGLLLMWCNLKFEGVLFRSDSRHNDIVDSLLECATKQTVMPVAQWHKNKLLGVSGYCQRKFEDGFMLTWCKFKFDGVLFNLDTYRRM